jgi:hypothetical protein
MLREKQSGKDELLTIIHIYVHSFIMCEWSSVKNIRLRKRKVKNIGTEYKHPEREYRGNEDGPYSVQKAENRFGSANTRTELSCIVYRIVSVTRYKFTERRGISGRQERNKTARITSCYPNEKKENEVANLWDRLVQMWGWERREKCPQKSKTCLRHRDVVADRR